jgi:hypothetical protein
MAISTNCFDEFFGTRQEIFGHRPLRRTLVRHTCFKAAAFLLHTTTPDVFAGSQINIQV